MFKYLSRHKFINRIHQIPFLKTINSRPISTKVFLVRDSTRIRSFSTNAQTDTKLNEPISISYGPKDTLLILGYNVKEDDLNSHIKSLEESLKLKLMTLDFYSPDIAQSFSDLAMAQHQSLEFINKAKENYLKSYEIWKKINGEESREVANILCLIGVVLRDLGDLEASKSALMESLSIDRKLNSPSSNLCSIYSLNNLASISHMEERYSEACGYYEDALRILLTATSGDENHRLISLLYYNLACSYVQIPDYYNASVALKRSKQIISNIGDPCNISHKVDDLLDEIKSENT